MWQTLKKQEIIEKLRTDEMQGLTLFFYNMLFRQPGIIFDSGFDIIQIKIYKIFKIHIQTQILL